MNTITLEFKPVKLKIPIEGLTFEVIEEAIFDIRQEIGRTAFVTAIKDYDEQLARQRPRGELKNICFKTRYMQTRVGDIRYKRTLYKEKATGKPRYLLDEALKVSKNQRMSLKLAQIMDVLAASGPYRAAKDSLSKLLGINLSHEALRQNVIREGKRLEEQETGEHKKMIALEYEMPKDIPEVVYTEADATYIRRQNKGKKKRGRHLEVKAGIGYTGKEARYDGGKRESKKLTRKMVYADIKAGRKNLRVIRNKKKLFRLRRR
jgi:hypothetical protein